MQRLCKRGCVLETPHDMLHSLEKDKWVSETADLVFAVHSSSATHLWAHMGPDKRLLSGREDRVAPA
jgi:hypothetical protein